MKLKLAVLILIAGSFVISCKKEDKEPSTPASTGGGGGGGGGGSSYPASNASAFSGIFTTGNYVGSAIIGSTTYTFNSNLARAYFSNTPQSNIYAASAVKVASLSLNGDSLSYSSSNSYYMSNGTVNIASETWSVNGANGIGTFTISNVITTPSAIGYLTLPDSISLATGFVAHINSVNANDAGLLISDGGSGFYYTPLQTGNNTVSVTASNLSSIATTTNGNISLVLNNKKAYVISGKDYQFNREFQYTKTLKIKP